MLAISLAEHPQTRMTCNRPDVLPCTRRRMAIVAAIATPPITQYDAPNTGRQRVNGNEGSAPIPNHHFSR